MKCYLLTETDRGVTEVYGIYKTFDYGETILKTRIGYFRAMGYELTGYDEKKEGEYRYIQMRRNLDDYCYIELECRPLE